MLTKVRNFGGNHGSRICSKLPFLRGFVYLPGSHDWSKMVEGIQDYIHSLNFGYRSALMNNDVKYLNALGEIVNEHTIKVITVFCAHILRILSSISIRNTPAFPVRLWNRYYWCIKVLSLSKDLYVSKMATNTVHSALLMSVKQAFICDKQMSV